MVLPVRIELTTSAIPRMRSTTELRQHVALSGDAALWPRSRHVVKAGCRNPASPLISAEMAQSKDQRAKRLAEALRENLRRRKAQARAAAAESLPPQPAATNGDCEDRS